MSFDRLSIAHRIYIGFSLLIIVLVGLGLFAMSKFDQMANETDAIGHKITLVSQANDYALSLQSLTASVLTYAQSANGDDRAGVDRQLATTQEVESQFTTLLKNRGFDRRAHDLHALSAQFSETLDSLLLRIENTGASADTILMGANKMASSGPELLRKFQLIGEENPAYGRLVPLAQEILKASNMAILQTMTYAIKPSEASLENARNATSRVDDLLGHAKDNMAGLSRNDKKAPKFLGRDNDLLKQGYVQFQGSNMGLINSYNEFREAIEMSQALAANIRIEAIEAQNETIASVKQQAQSTIESYAAIVIFAALIMIGVAWLIARSILGPLLRLTHEMGVLGEGNTDITIADCERRDEIGTMAQAVKIFRENALEVDRLTQQRLDDQKRDQEKRSASLMAMADTIESETGVVVEKVADETKHLGKAVGTMSQTSEEVSHQAQTVAQSALSSLSLAQQVSEAAQTLTGSITQVAQQVERQSQIASTAQEQADASSKSVQSLSDAADQIVSIVALIDDIAHQTNMLALNATIEAERAGDMGKGFAVVASEVKLLANQTSNATSQISQQINDMMNVTRECVSSIEEITSIIADMAQISQEVSQSVLEQTQETDKISNTIHESCGLAEELNHQVSDAARKMQGVKELSDELGSASKRVTYMVESMQMSLNTAVRSASENMGSNQENKANTLVNDVIDVVLVGESGTFRSQLIDISNNGFALKPTIDVSKGALFDATISGIKGTYQVEILNKHGLKSQKTRLRFLGHIEERHEIVQFVISLWAKRLRYEILEAPHMADAANDHPEAKIAAE